MCACALALSSARERCMLGPLGPVVLARFFTISFRCYGASLYQEEGDTEGSSAQVQSQVGQRAHGRRGLV
eukprot:2074551-Amphidinium_carterae.1